MILWCDGGHSAPENMRRDACLLARLDSSREGTPAATPVLRLFRFDPPGITLGRAQRPERTLDLERCRRDGVEWAVRPTGGRAIFHDEEWTYSFAARIADPEWGGDLSEAYARVSRLIHASLTALGVAAALVAQRAPRGAPREDQDGGPVTDPARPSCFASTARHELELDGRKLAGSAQRRTAVALLQQGSILLGDSHLRLADYVCGDDDVRAAVRRALAAHAAHAGTRLGAHCELERWAAAITSVMNGRVRAFSAGEGAFLLTPGEPAPYTASPK